MNSTANYSNSLKIYLNKLDLSTRFQDVTNVYLLAPIAFIGTFLILIKIIVLLNPSLKGRMYQFLLITGICDFIKLFFSSFIFLFRCGALCPYGYNYYFKLYEQICYLYISNICLVYATLISIIASLERLLSFNTKTAKLSDKFLPFYMKCIILFVISVIINYPDYILTRSVKEIGKLVIFNESNQTVFTFETLYSSVDNQYAKIIWIKSLTFAFTILRKLTLLIILITINVLVAIKFHKLIKNKRALSLQTLRYSSLSADVSHSIANTVENRGTSNKKPFNDKLSKSESAVTKMIMIMCLSTFFGNIMDSFTPILFTIVDSVTYNYYILLSNCTLYIFHSLDIFLLLNFNENFKTTFRKMLMSIKFLKRSSRISAPLLENKIASIKI